LTLTLLEFLVGGLGFDEFGVFGFDLGQLLRALFVFVYESLVITDPFLAFLENFLKIKLVMVLRKVVIWLGDVKQGVDQLSLAGEL
jgi:hypothetical protein